MVRFHQAGEGDISGCPVQSGTAVVVKEDQISEEAAFAVGDTVRPNSGSDLMTVTSIDRDSVTCVWFVKGIVKSQAFPTKALQKSDGTPKEITINFGKKLPGDPGV
jgi:uncharacterized protein YodC (DUF2158 family)